jgi:hypothetical protein
LVKKILLNIKESFSGISSPFPLLNEVGFLLTENPHFCFAAYKIALVEALRALVEDLQQASLPARH